MDATQSEDIRVLVEDTIEKVYFTGYFVARDGIKYISFSFDHYFIKGMIHSRVLNETLNRTFQRWFPLNAFIKALIGSIVNNPGFTLPVTAFVKQGATNAIEGGLNSKPTMTKEILSPPNRSPSASVVSSSHEESRVRYSRRKRHSQNYQNTVRDE